MTTCMTWLQFRMSVQVADGVRLSMLVTVHTHAARNGWRVAEVDGPEL